MDADDILRSLTPLGVATCFVIGVAVGWIALRGIDIESVAATLLQLGLPFFVIMALIRIAEHNPRWEGWIGIAGLYLVYAGGMVAGFWLRRRTGHRLP